MLVLLIVVAVVAVLAVALAFGGGFGGGYAAPTVVRRVVYRRPPVRRVVTEHRVVDDPYGPAAPVADPAADPLYRP